MSTNCIILSGLHNANQSGLHSSDNDFSKTAGPYRIATELRDAGYTTQVIDISFFYKFDQLFKLILKRMKDFSFHRL